MSFYFFLIDYWGAAVILLFAFGLRFLFLNLFGCSIIIAFPPSYLYFFLLVCALPSHLFKSIGTAGLVLELD